MARLRIVAAMTAASIGLVACGGGEPHAAMPTAGEEEVLASLAGTLSVEEAAEAASNVNAFGFELHRAVAEAGENTVTSPLSASVLLAMVAAGAGGDTAEEMVEVLRLEGPRDTRYAALLADLSGQRDATLSVANSLWAAREYPFEEDYLAFTRDTFGAMLDEVDLGSQPAADAIDGWVDEHTDGRIDGIADELGLPDPQAVLVLLNAVYFLGTWTTTFDEANTVDAAFRLPDGTEVDVPTMRRHDPELAFMSGDGFQMVRLPYGSDERFGMDIVLPDEGVALDDLMAGLDAQTWQTAQEGLSSTTLSQIALPRFTLEWDSELNETLKALGIELVFGGGDLTPMSPGNPYLDTVVQKTYIRVDEEGTEAAAVTGGVTTLSLKPDLVIDRPFLFTISDRDTGTILFMGSVHDPRG